MRHFDHVRGVAQMIDLAVFRMVLYQRLPRGAPLRPEGRVRYQHIRVSTQRPRNFAAQHF